MEIFKNTLYQNSGKSAKTTMSGISETEIGPPPEYGGSPNSLNPEEMLVASVNSCIMLVFYHFAEKYDRKPESLGKSVGCWARILESESEMNEKIKSGAKTRGISVDTYRKRVQSSLWGTPEIFAETITQYKEQGVSHIIFMFPYGEKKEQIELFGEKVLPLL